MAENGANRENWDIWRPALLVFLALVFTLPYVTIGFFADDYFLVNALAQDELPVSRLRGAWSTIDVPAFNNLWWRDADLATSFWRPLATLTIEASVRAFGKNPVPLHLLGIIVHCLVVLAVYRLAFKLTGRRGVALLAGLFYVTCEDHSMTVAWISTITNLLCTLFVLLSLLGYINYLKKGRTSCLVGSMISLLLAFGFKETAVIAPVAIILLSLFMPRGSDESVAGLTHLRNNARLVSKRPVAWLPAVLILVGYIIFYKAMGFGDNNSLQYLNPISAPLTYLRNIVWQLPVMWLGTLSIWPPFVTAFDHSLLPYVIGPGILAFVLWIIALWPLRDRALVGWATLVYLIALLPTLVTDGSERGLYLPMAFASILLALLAQTIAPIARRMIPQPSPVPRWTQAAGWIALITIMLPGFLVSLARPTYARETFSMQENVMKTALPHLKPGSSGNLVITGAPNMFFAFYCGAVLEYLVDDPPQVWLLSAAPGKYLLERTGDSTFVITTDAPGWISNTMARYIRTHTDVPLGRWRELPLFDAVVERITDDGRDVLAVSFRFKVAFDDSNLTILRWSGDSFEPLDVASMPIGASIVVADNPGLWELMLK